MSLILDAFKAGSVHRWHCNPWLAGTHDRTDGHGARVARIIDLLWPDAPKALLQSALRHDDGEVAVGDVKAPAKDADPVFAEMLEDRETVARQSLWGPDPALTLDDLRKLKFADRLDAWIWARHHRAPMSVDGWPAAMCWLFAEAQMLGVDAEWNALVLDMP